MIKNLYTSAWDYILLALFQSRSSVDRIPSLNWWSFSERSSSILTNQLTTLYYILNEVAVRAENKRWDHSLRNLTWLTLHMYVLNACSGTGTSIHWSTGTILWAGLTLQKRPRSTRNWLWHCTCVSGLVACGNQTMHTSTGLHLQRLEVGTRCVQKTANFVIDG